MATRSPSESTDQPELSVKKDHGVVTLTSDPWLKPLVCGICGHQFETGRGLDMHIRSHKIGNRSPRNSKTPQSGSQSDTGLSERRKTGLPPGRKSNSSDTAVDQDFIIPAASSPAGLRRSSRSSKRASWMEEYVMPKLVSGGGDDEEIEEKSEDKTEKNVTTPPRKRAKVIEPELTNTANSEDNLKEDSLPVLRTGETNPDDVPDWDTDNISVEKIPTASAETLTTEKQKTEMSNQAGDTVEKLRKEDHGNPDQITTDENMADYIEENEDQLDQGCIEDPDDPDYTGFKVTGGTSERRSSNGGTTLSKKRCEVCGKLLGSSHMRRHMLAVHLNQKDYVCEKDGCGKKFAVISELKHHVLTVHDKAMSKECTECGKVLSDSHSLKTHMKNKHVAKAPKPEVACELCGKQFRNIRACSSHMKQHTMEKDPQTCNKCQRSFMNLSKLAFHQKVNPGCNVAKHCCEVCGYKASSPWRLNNHMQQTHSTVRNYQCEYCMKLFKTKEMVKNHIHKCHTGTPSLSCPEPGCDRRFFYKAELKEHVQIHSGSRPFTCHICKQSFKTMHVLRGHINGKHSDTWFSCGFCKFTTSHKKSMKRHMKLVHKLTNVQLEVTVEDPADHGQDGSNPTTLEYITSEDGTVQIHIPESQVQVEELDHTMTTSTSDNVQILTSGGLDVGHMTASCSTAEEVSEVLVALGSIAEAAEFQAMRDEQDIQIPNPNQEVLVATQHIATSSDSQGENDGELVKGIILSETTVMDGKEVDGQTQVVLEGVVYDQTEETGN